MIIYDYNDDYHQQFIMMFMLHWHHEYHHDEYHREYHHERTTTTAATTTSIIINNIQQQSINQSTNLPNQPTNPPTNQPTNPSLKPLLIWKQVSFENTRPPIRGSSHGGPHRHLLVVFLTTSCSWQILFPQGPADCNWLAIASLYIYIYIKWIIILSFEVHEPLNEVWIWKRRGIWVTIPGCDRNMMEPGPVHPDQNVGEKWIVLTNLCANIVLQKKSSTMYHKKKTPDVSP